jgi:hypothetical protein
MAAACVGACGHAARILECGPAPVPAAESAGASTARDSLHAVVDTEETLEPDLRIRTWDRIYVVRRRLLQADAGGRVPGGLSELVHPDDFIDYVRDAWRRELGYTRAGSHFEIRSAGPDGCFNTADDIAATEASMPPRP